MSELSDIVIIVDSREKSEKRIKTLTEWAQCNGAFIESKALALCDYAFCGEFRGLPVSLGIEYKTLDNFLSDSIEDMEDKLVKSTELYEHVAFFIEVGNYTFDPQPDSNHCTLNHSNAKVQQRLELQSKTLAAFEGFCDTLGANGIHVRQLRSSSQFPYSLYNLLVYLQSLHVLKVKPESLDKLILKHYMTIPEVGLVRAKKLLECYPNASWLNSASEESLIQVLGRTTGIVVYQFLHNHEYETENWRNGRFRDGTNKILALPSIVPEAMEKELKVHGVNEGSNPSRAIDVNPELEVKTEIKSAIINYLMEFGERTIEDIFKHFSLEVGDSDRVELLKYIKELALEGKVTSDHKLFKLTSQPHSHPDTDINSPILMSSVSGDSAVISKEDSTSSHPLPEPLFHTPPNTISGNGDKQQGKNQCQSNPRLAASFPGGSVDQDFFGENNPDWQVATQQHKMNLQEQLKAWFEDGLPHRLDVTVQAHSQFDKGKVFDICAYHTQTGYLKKTIVNKQIVFQKI